jgi:glycosyltransferase involved in cell wall biosynthesis
MPEKSSFTVVIPCYNEEKAVDSFLTELKSFVELFQRNFGHIELKVLIVDNNSTDQSVNLLTKKSIDACVKVISCSTQGYGAALKYGFQQNTSDYYAFADLDNTYPLNDLIMMLKLIQIKNADIILASHLHKNSEMQFLRMIGNLVYLKFTNFLFSSQISDSCSGMRIFNHRIKHDILNLNQSDLSFSIEMTAQALARKWSILEYPIHYRDRLGPSKLSIFADGFRFLFVLLRVKFFGK